MQLKLIARMVEFSADANPNKKWSSTFIGVFPAGENLTPEIGAMRNAMLPRYDFMCAAIDDALDAEVLQAWLTAVEKIESGAQKEIEKSTEGWEFTLSREGVRFEGLYDQGTGGQVTLAQFKLAVQTYVRFLQDPERKPVEVPFPEE